MKKCDMCDEDFDEIDAEYIFKAYLVDRGYSGSILEAEFENWFDDDMCGWRNVGRFMEITS